MKINYKKLNDLATVPTSGSTKAAGYDLYAATSYGVCIEPHQTVKIGTGIAMEIPDGYFGGIYARSGLATKLGLAPANKVGVIDADYRGEIIVALHNHSDSQVIIEPKERVAQIIIQEFLPIEFNEVSELSDTDRGDGGFGSTGNK